MQYNLLRAVVALAVTSVMIPAAQAEVLELDFAGAIRLAQEQSPTLSPHRAEVAVARSRIEGATKWRENPSVSVTSGPRFDDETSVDLMFGVKQPFAPGGRPKARAEVARAEHRVAVLHEADEERQLAARTARTFGELLYWQRRVEIAAASLELVREVEAVAARRNEVGDVGGLDPSVALLARARAEADVATVEARRLSAESELRWLLGVETGTEIVAAGDLRTLGRQDAAPAEERVDVQLARAATEVERARQHLARRDRVPRFALGVTGGAMEGATVLRGVLELTLPVIARGQPELLEATAAEEARREHAAVVASRATHELQAARRRVAVLDAAVARFADGGLAAVEKTAQIATASYKAGAIALPDLLLIRGELVAAEEDFSELLLLAAMARIEVLESSGTLITPNP